MKIISFNVNSIRKRLESRQLHKLVEKHSPDIIGMQETKVTDEDFPVREIEKLGYDVVFLGQKTHYGAALMARIPMEEAYKNFPGSSEDEQKRVVGARFPLKDGKDLFVINGYFPQGENRNHPQKFPYKQWFYSSMMDLLKENYSPDSYLSVIGDMNIAPQDVDIGIGEANAKRWLQQGKCAFLPEEREMMKTLLDWGLYDSFRICQPDNHDTYSWFDYRSRGFEADPKRGLRIDLILNTEPLQKKCTETGIDYEIRGLKPSSDHAPVWASFNL